MPPTMTQNQMPLNRPPQQSNLANTYGGQQAQFGQMANKFGQQMRNQGGASPQSGSTSFIPGGQMPNQMPQQWGGQQQQMNNQLGQGPMPGQHVYSGYQADKNAHQARYGQTPQGPSLSQARNMGGQYRQQMQQQMRPQQNYWGGGQMQRQNPYGGGMGGYGQQMRPQYGGFGGGMPQRQNPYGGQMPQYCGGGFMGYGRPQRRFF